MKDNLSDVVLYSFDKFKQNRHVYYQLNGGFEEKGSQTASLAFSMTSDLKINYIFNINFARYFFIDV